MRRVVLLVAVSACITSPYDRVRHADRLVEEHDYEGATREYARAMEDAGQDDWISYHVAHGYAKMRTGAAAPSESERLVAAMRASDPSLAARYQDTTAEAPPLPTVEPAPATGWREWSSDKRKEIAIALSPSMAAPRIVPRFHLMAGQLSLPMITAPSGMAITDTKTLIGFGFGLRLFSRLREDPYGLGIADEGYAEIGYPYAGASYSLGLAYRRFAVGGLVVGVRPNASIFLFGGDTPSHQSIPLFARLELALPGSAVTVEGVGVSVLGDERWGGTVQYSRGHKVNDMALYASLRVERFALDGTFEDPMDSMVTFAAPDVETTTILVQLGIAGP